jgi:predicted enzyme related to lactoylglutathione lyase
MAPRMHRTAHDKTSSATVVETFFSVEVRDMSRATAFYVTALGATVVFALPFWTSLRIAGVRIGLALSPEATGSRSGLHFAVTDLDAARAHIERAGGRLLGAPTEVAAGVVIADVMDTEGNTLTLTRR